MAFPTTTMLAQAPEIDFEKDAVGKAAAGFSFALTGKGRQGVWLVKRDDATHGNVLAQTDVDTTDYRFPVAILDGFTATDIDASVQFRAISGRVDQGAGLVWRYQDANNYYITRCNALEDNCTIYRVVNGNRQAFLNKSVKVATSMWHTLSVKAAADHFVVTFDGQIVLDARDATFKDGGKVGLWTKADSVIYFDNLSVSRTSVTGTNGSYLIRHPFTGPPLKKAPGVITPLDLKTSPSFITNCTSFNAFTSSSGLPETPMRSAMKPALIGPRVCSVPLTL
jgi:hypothetical protein